jgi:hypothetical protein
MIRRESWPYRRWQEMTEVICVAVVGRKSAYESRIAFRASSLQRPRVNQTQNRALARMSTRWNIQESRCN